MGACSIRDNQSSCMLAPRAVGIPTAGMVPSTRGEVVVPACASSGALSIPHHHTPSSFRASDQLSPEGAAGGERTGVSRARGGASELVGHWAEERGPGAKPGKSSSHVSGVAILWADGWSPTWLPLSFPAQLLGGRARAQPCHLCCHPESMASPRLLNPRQTGVLSRELLMDLPW